MGVVAPGEKERKFPFEIVVTGMCMMSPVCVEHIRNLCCFPSGEWQVYHLVILSPGDGK